MEISENARITLKENIHVQELAGEAVLLNLNNNHYFSLDEVSYRMFSVFTTATSFKEGLDILNNEYDVEAGQLRQDSIEFIESLVEAGLVKIANE